MKRNYLFFVPFLLIVFWVILENILQSQFFYVIFLLIIILSFSGFLDVFLFMFRFSKEKLK
ncbi:hypothetical protein A7456_10345 [Moraxella nonliquefaciens]|uniref:Uncharacterized protein n=1 Tax=Moraxella nonliquefaciens TaxID=478 RepID=A0A1B8QMS8_MORNO|nr:hypothetical protein A9Z57_04640 [Moraxella catarrhalis]OBX85311.1 hypothetical protein A7456_10345 [Moraxella nonliquefaciens]